MSCPVAKKRAAMALAACALNPPSDPAMADPMKFLVELRETREEGVVWRMLDGGRRRRRRR